MKEEKALPTICHHLLHQAQTNGDKVGFRYKKEGQWKDITFGEHFNAICSLSAGLVKLGVEPGDSVAILADTSIHWSRMEFAVLGAKAKVVPIYPTSTAQDIEYITNHAEVKYIYLDTPANLEKIFSIEKQCPNLKACIVHCKFEKSPSLNLVDYKKLPIKEEEALKEVEKNLASTRVEDLCTICYTSGTTGKPKGVILSHSCITSVMDDLAIALKSVTNPNESLLSFLPMSHIFGRIESYLPHLKGWTQSFVENLDSIVDNLQEIKPTVFLSVPRVFEKAYTKICASIQESSPTKQKIFDWSKKVGTQWVKETNKKGTASIKTTLQYMVAEKLVFSKIKARFGGRLKICTSGGAPLPSRIGDFMQMCGIPIYEAYGLTETTGPISMNLPGKNKVGSVGKLLPEVLAKIAEDGEILVKSKKVFQKYHKNEEATKEVLKEGWFYTGDIGHLDGDGYLKITDRKKDLIKNTGGKYIAPQKIESLAKTSPYLNQILVYGDDKPYITALITLHCGAIIRYAKKNKILFNQFEGLVKHKEIKEIVQSELDKLNKELPKWERVRRFYILPNEFTVEKGELTPSMKIKRKLLTNKFKETLNKLYE